MPRKSLRRFGEESPETGTRGRTHGTGTRHKGESKPRTSSGDWPRKNKSEKTSSKSRGSVRGANLPARNFRRPDSGKPAGTARTKREHGSRESFPRSQNRPSVKTDRTDPLSSREEVIQVESYVPRGTRGSLLPPGRQHEKGERSSVLNNLKKSLKGERVGLLKEDGVYRINRYLAAAGFGSRRDAERYVLEGRVMVGTRVVTNLDARVKPGDLVTVDGKVVGLPETFFYYAMNKPAGYEVTAKGSPYAEKTIYDLIPENLQSLRYAGRLDKETRGLLILSTDGKFIQAISHPGTRLIKKYIATVSELPPEDILRKSFLRGIEDGGELLRALSVTVLDRKMKRVEIVLGEGRNRQIRRMFKFHKIRVLDLYRQAIGSFDLSRVAIEEGEMRPVEPADILTGKSAARSGGTKILQDFDPWRKRERGK